ncbi:peptide-binding protein [Algisphaera agarilytica]|uniref:Peptide/nickel transport system substrate-binding protein n=1 Tax=Algisphaera agarilytica TaxID=1385975 RepID=A0A7X0LLF7_9BACT|nr:peptide-binding protein [Algisphaera agarilytica]MBB6430591.1 peptide/nickel transport system substrate-binding protein [Algisphaera agarilytica]
MENRFGFKDLVLTVLLVAILASIWLAMKQYDRQWEVMQRIDDRLAEQAEVLRQLNTTLSQGVRVSGDGDGGPTTVSSAPPLPHYRWEAAREQEGYAQGDWFVDAFAQQVGKLTPLISTDAYQSTIESYVLESLITRDPETLDWIPWIAHSWEVSEDGLTIAFNLRDDVVFSDGVPLTSEDVLFTLDLIRNPEINAPRLVPYYESIESLVAEGPHRVVFTLSEPYFQSLTITGGMDILAKHYYEQFSPEEFNTSTGLLFGSGPYKLPINPEDWQPGSGQVELVRNDEYWGPRPTFDRLRWQEITDEQAQLVSLRNGDIDRYSVRPEQYVKLKDDKALNETADLYEYSAVSAGYRYIGWNQVKDGKPTPFADVRVRRAMTMLLNRQEMCEQLMAGLATVATGPFNPLSPQYDPTVDPIAYDPDAAKALLREAGFADTDGDGVLEGPDGKPFRFKLIYPSGSTNYQQMAAYCKDAYARAGITMELDPTEFNTMIDRIQDRNFEAITLGWGGVIESDPKQIFHSEMIEGGGDNYVGYRNAELDALIDEARMTVDADERTALWHRVHRILQEDQPYTFMFNRKSVIFLDDRFGNVKVTKVGISDPVEMFVPRSDQRWTQ